jgi:hypothetical protein
MRCMDLGTCGWGTVPYDLSAGMCTHRKMQFLEALSRFGGHNSGQSRGQRCFKPTSTIVKLFRS